MASQVTLLLFAFVVAITSGKLIQQMKGGHGHRRVVQLAKVSPAGYQPKRGNPYGKYLHVDWCKNGKYYAECPKDCSRYLQKIGYYAYSMPCAPGTHWSQKKCTCVMGDCKKPNKYIYIPKGPMYQKRGRHGRKRVGPPPPPPPPHGGHGHEEHPPPGFHGGQQHAGFGHQKPG